MSQSGELSGKRLSILHVIGSVDPRAGGPIEGIKRQDQAARSFGSREIASLDPPDAPFLADCPMKVYPLGTGSYDPAIQTKRLKRFGYTPRFVPWLRAHAGDYDCVVVNGLWNYSSVGASRVLPKHSTPYFVFTHGMLDPWFRSEYPIKHLVKQVSWSLFEGPLVRHARAVLFTTEDERQLARGQFSGHTYREEVVGYGAADVEGDASKQIAAFRAAVPNLGNRPYLLFLSRIHQKKGCELLLRAFARVAASRPDLDLVMAGPDQMGLVAKLQREARLLRVDHRVHWPGMITGDLKWGAFRGADAFILPSHQENFGIVVAEALACGIPTLITDKVNIWREVDAAGAGLVAPDNQTGIDSLFDRFIALDEPALTRLRAAARACFETHFDMNKVALNVLGTMASFI